MKHIKNPLTIIALFSGSAEIAATVVLFKLPPELQIIFLWFVMLFPIVLVVLFFITLNFNPTVLYAPSDFSNEDNYLKTIRGRHKTASEIQKNDEKLSTPN